MRHVSCHDCGRAVVFATMPGGSRFPYDADPADPTKEPLGLVMLGPWGAPGELAARPVTSKDAARVGSVVYRCHLLTCPAAVQERAR